MLLIHSAYCPFDRRRLRYSQVLLGALDKPRLDAARVRCRIMAPVVFFPTARQLLPSRPVLWQSLGFLVLFAGLALLHVPVRATRIQYHTDLG